MLKVFILGYISIEILIRVFSMLNSNFRDMIADQMDESIRSFRLNNLNAKVNLSIWSIFFILILLLW